MTTTAATAATANDRSADVPPETLALCYVSGPWAYFTTQPVSEQWGDDWDDAPYEHNAGEPYTFTDYDREKGRRPWAIVRVAYDGPFDQPCHGTINSTYSVEQINAGAVAWLRPSCWIKDALPIFAGATMPEFIRRVKMAGGQVFAEVKE